MLEAGYVLLSALMATIIFLAYHAVLKKVDIGQSIRKKRMIYSISALILWFVYVFVMSQSGFLANFELPPRFPLLLIMPLFVFTGTFLYRHRNSEILHAIPKSWAIYYQSFRIGIESLFVASLPFGILPYHVTFEGYNYDIVFAMTAPFVAYLVFNRKKIPQKVALFWNYLGLIVIAWIIFLFTTTAYFPSVWGSETSLANVKFTQFYYMLVPAFLMPSAVFMHVLSIIQLSKKE